MESQVEDRAERWFLNALWTGCATGLIHARVPVLDIVLFTKGVPTRWLHTLENGYLIARSFKDQNQSAQPSSDPDGLRAALLSGGDDEGHGSSSSSSSSSSGASAGVDAETSLQRLAEAIQNFARFVNRFRGKSASEPLAQGDKIALIVYRDGRREAMGLQDLSVMAPHGQWLASVSYMQPMLPLHEVKVGVYERKNLRVGSSIVKGTDFLGSRRSMFLRNLLNRHRFNDQDSSSSPQVTDEDIYTMRLVRLLHLLFTIPDGGSASATPFLDDIVGSTGVAPEYDSSSSTRKGGGGGGGSVSSRRREDMVSSDSESGKRIMTMLSPLRILRVVGLAVQYAMDYQGRLWISGPLLTAVQPLTPDVGALGTKKQDGSTRGIESAASRQRATLFPAPKPVQPVMEKEPKDFGLTAIEAKAAALFEARGAAEAVARDIGKLVQEGKSRGLPLELCWQHFDEGMSGRGKISDEIFRERLALLGFTLHDAGFLELKKLVPHNRDGLIGFYEFEQFILKANEPRVSAMRGGGGGDERVDLQNKGLEADGDLTDSDDQHRSPGFSDSEVKKQELGESEFPSSSSSMMMHEANASGSSDAFLDAQSAYSALQERFNKGLKPGKTKQGQRKRKLQQQQEPPPVLSLVQPSDTSYTLDKSLDSGVSLASDAQPRAVNTLSQMMASIGDISAISAESSKPSVPSVSNTYGQQAKPKGFEAAWLKERKKTAAREAQKLALEAERAAQRDKERMRINAELERGKPPLISSSIQQAKSRRTKKQNRNGLEPDNYINDEQQTRAIIEEGVSYEERMQINADAFLGYNRSPPPIAAASPVLQLVNDEDAHLLTSFESDDDDLDNNHVVNNINYNNISNLEQSSGMPSPSESRTGKKQPQRSFLGGLPQGDPYLNFLMKQARPGKGPSAAGGGFTKAGLLESTAQNLFEDIPELAEPNFDPLPQNRLNSLVSASSKFGQVLVPGGAVTNSSKSQKGRQPEISMDTINKTLAMRRGRRLRSDNEERQKQTEHEARMRERHNAIDSINERKQADETEEATGHETVPVPTFSTPAATLLFPEPQEWSFDETTSVLFNIIQGPPSVTTPLGVVSLDAQRTYVKASNKSKRAQPPISPYASGRAVDILFIPDLYDDIDGLSTSLLSTVNDCPGARLLIFQYPGLPGTTCVESVEPVIKPNPPRWSPDFCALILLHFVRWLRDPTRALWGPIAVQHPHGDLFTENEGGMNYRDVVIVGSGVGAHIASIFVTQFLSFVPDFMGHRHSALGGKGSRDFILMAATRALVLLNGYGFVDKSLKATFDRLGQVHTQLGSIPSTHVSIEELEAKKEKGRMIEIKKGDHITPRPPFENVVAEATSTTLGQNSVVDGVMNKVDVPSVDNIRPSSRKVKERGGDRGSLWQALSVEPMDPKKSQRLSPADIIRSEAVESISTVLFSRSFLEDHGPKTPLMALLQGNEQVADGDPHVDAGLAKICRGAARGMDVRPNLRDMPLPLLLINGSENAFVLPHLSFDIAIARARTGIDKLADKSKQELLSSTGLLNGTPQAYAKFLEVAGFPPSQDQLAELCGDGVSDIAAIDDVSVVNFMRAAGLDAEIEKATEFADFENSESKVGWKQPRFRPATVDGSKRFHMVSGPDGKLELRESTTMLPKPVPQMRQDLLEARPGTRSALVRDKELSLKDARQANSRPTFCVWLKAGHALLTERRGIVLKTLEAIFKGRSKESRSLQQQAENDPFAIVGRNTTVNEESANLVRLYENNQSISNSSAAQVDNDQRFAQNRDPNEQRNSDFSRFTIPPPAASSSSSLAQSNGLFSSGPQLVSPSSLGYLPSPTAASRPTFIFPSQYPERHVDVEELSRQSQARVMVAAELKRRGMNTEGTELELLARLEEALEAEASAALQTEEDISDSAAVRLRKAMRLEAELEERKKRKEVQAAKTQDLTKPGVVIKRALPKQIIDKNDLVDSEVYTRERKDMQDEDILSSKYAAFLLAQQQCSIDADIIATALTQLRSSGIEHDDITILSEGILRAIGRDRLEQLFKGGLIAPSLLQKASDQIAVGATKGAAASLAQGLSYLKVVGKIQEIDNKAAEARETAIAAALASKKRFASMYESDGALERQNAKDEAAKQQKLAEEEAKRQRDAATEAAANESGGVGLDIRRAFRDLGVDQKRTRAAKLAILRLSSVFAQLKFEDEERGYALTSEDPESLQLGVRRLVAHVNDVRSRFKSTLKRWSRSYMRTRQTESSVVIEKGRLAILKRSLEMVKRERTRIEYALRAAGIPSKTIATTDAIMTALREAGEIEIFIEDQLSVIKTKEDVVEFELIDLASHMTALSATRRKMQEKEQALRDMRTHLSMLIAAAKKRRREAKVDHERSSKEASAALTNLFNQQERLTTLRLEWIRVSGVKSKWFDTSVWNAGTMVRVRTTDLREWLQDELIRQKIIVAENIAAIESLRGETETSDEDYARIHDEVMALTKTLTIVVNTIRTAPSFASPGVDPVADAQAEAEVHIKTKQAAADGRLIDDGFDEKNRDSEDDDDDDHSKNKDVSRGVGTREASRRDLSIAWREKLIHREADSMFNLAEIFSSQDPAALVDVGGLTETVPSSEAQLGWVTNWMDPIPQTDESGGIAAAERQSSSSSASQDQDQEAVTVESLSLPFHYGYASKSTLAEGMSAVIGTPYDSLSSVLPLHMHRNKHRATSSRGGQRQARTQQTARVDDSEIIPPTAPPPPPPSSTPIVYSDGLAAAMAQAEKESKMNAAKAQTQREDVSIAAATEDSILPPPTQTQPLDPSSRPPRPESSTISPVRLSNTEIMRRRLFDLRTQTNILGGGSLRNGGKPRVSRLVAPTVGEQMEIAKLRLVPESIRGILVRLRPAFDRSIEEKKWIAFDRRMHPRLYTRISPEDAEVFEFDPLYKTNVSKTLLFNLAALPTSPLQALPFMRTQAEVQIHSLLAKYLHGQGEDDERRRDQESGARALAQAAVARGFVARTKLPAFRTHEEADWVSLDRLIRPHLYLGEPPPHPVGAPVLRKKTSVSGKGGENSSSSGTSNSNSNSSVDQSSGTPRIPPGIAEAINLSVDQQVRALDTSSVPIVPPVVTSTLNADDAQLGLDTYENNLSYEATRQKEGAFGNSVRRIFQKVFRFNEKKSSQAEKQRKENAARRKENEAIRKAADTQPQSKSSDIEMFDDATYPPEDDSNEKNDANKDGKAGGSKKTRVLGATGIQIHGGWTRPSGGTIGLGFTREELIDILQTPSSLLKTGKERRAQLLLRAYGSDGGEWMYRAAISHPTPVVTSLREIPEANDSLLTQLKDRKDVDYSQELACQYPDGDDTNTAACAAIVANGTVLVRANHSIEIFSVSDAPLRPGVTVDHAFEVPGSFFDVAGYGTRARPLPGPNASRSNNVAARQNVVVPSASSCMAMGSPPPWQRNVSTVDMVDIAIKEAQAKGIGASSAAIAAAAAAAAAASDSHVKSSEGPKKDTVPGGVAETLEKCAPDENALKTQCEIETGIEGALPVAFDMTVTIAFHGGFVDHSYVLGRLTTSLYRDAFVSPSDHPSQAEQAGSVYSPALYSMVGESDGAAVGGGQSSVPSLTISTSEGRVIQTLPLLLPPFLSSTSDEYEDGGKRETRNSLPSYASATRPLRNIQETTRPSSKYSNSRPSSQQNDSSQGSASGVINPLPSSISILSAEFDKDIYAGPGLPREPGAYQLGGISGPAGLPPVIISKAVLSALSYPNDVDPFTLQSSVQRNGDVKKANNKKGTLPPRHTTQLTSLTSVDEDVESDPETYLGGSSNVMASFAKRHKRRSRMISENVVKDTEARLNLRRPKGWFLNTESQHAQLSDAFATGAKFSTLSSTVDTRIVVEKSSSIYLRPDGTVASSANEPNVMPSSLVADELFHDESIGADIIGLGMSTKRPTLKRFAATGELATASSSTTDTLVPLWREREDSNHREELTRSYFPEGVDLAKTAASYSVPEQFNSKTMTSKKKRTRSLDASNSRLRTISTTLQSEVDRSEQAEFDEDGFVIVRKPNVSSSETQPLGESAFPTFTPAQLNNSFPIGVGAASGAGDGSGSVRIKDSRSMRAKHKRPLTYHPSQTPPLARAPLTHLFPNIPQDQVIANSRFAIGYAVAKDCSPNTVDNFGKIVIRHEPLHAPITPGKYVVSVSGLSAGSYSISVVCGLAYPSHTVISGSIRAAASAKTKTLSAKEDVRSIIQSQRLGQRKRQLVGHLIYTTDKEMQEIQSSINMLRTALDTGIILRQDLGSDDEDSFDDVGVESNLKEQIFEDKSGRKVDEDGESVEDSESEDEDAIEDAGVIAAKRRRQLKDEARNDDDDPETAMAKAILIARRKRQRLDVTNPVKTCIQKRLKKLDIALLSTIRVLTTRKREYQDVSDGLDALAEARMRRESDLERLLSQNQEYAEFMPAIAKSVLSILHDPVHGQMATTTANLSLHTKQNSKLERFGVHNIQEIMSLTGSVEAPEDSALIKALSNEVTEAEKKTKKKKKVTSIENTTDVQSSAPSALKPEDEEDETLESGECFAIVSLDAFEDDSGATTSTKKTSNPAVPMPTIVRSSTRSLQKQMFATRLVDYRYNYPEPDHDAVVYSSKGPFFLLWKTALESSKLLEASSSPADLVRSKRIEDLTVEERKWMSLDRVIHPEFYSFGTSFASENEDFATKNSPSKSPTKGLEMEKTIPVLTAAAVSSSGLTTISEGPLPEGSGTETTNNEDEEALNGAPPTKLDGRFDLTVSNKTMFKALYLSVEDKAGLRGNNRDIGKQATTVQLLEGSKGMIEYGKTKVPDLNVDTIEVGLPSELGGLGWALENLHEHKSSEKKSALTAGTSALDKLLPKCEYQRIELLRIRSLPIHQLSLEERSLRKLMVKFHEHSMRPNLAKTLRKRVQTPSNVAVKTVGSGIGGGPAKDLYYDEETRMWMVAGDHSALPPHRLANAAAEFSKMRRFQAVGSPFAMARSAVPIPSGAPLKLRKVLQERATRLQKLWDEANQNMQHSQAINQNAIGKGLSSDVDERSRELLDELDRINSLSLDAVDSTVLHGMEQRFTPSVLIDQLEMEIDRVLLSQVYEREAIEKALLTEATDMAAESAARKAAIEAKAIRDKREITIQKMVLEEGRRATQALEENIARGKRVLLTNEEIAERARLQAVKNTLEGASSSVNKKRQSDAQKTTAKRWNGEKSLPLGGGGLLKDAPEKAEGVDNGAVKQDQEHIDWGGGDYSYDSRDPLKEIGGLNLWGDPLKPMTPRRAARLVAERERKKAEQEADTKAGTDVVIGGRLSQMTLNRRQQKMAARQLALKEEGKNSDSVALLLPNQCRACFTVPCQWTPCLSQAEVEAIKSRQSIVEAELFRVRRIKFAPSMKDKNAMIKSTVSLSHLQGGPLHQTKDDLVFELAFETSALKSALRLRSIDEELHSAYASRVEEFTTVALHGHPQRSWRANVIVQLEAEVSRIVARDVSNDLIEDVLNYMLEGWHFGERSSTQIVAGYVPNLNNLRPLRPFESSSKAASILALQGPSARARAMDAARGLLPAVNNASTVNAAAVASLARSGFITMSLTGQRLDLIEAESKVPETSMSLTNNGRGEGGEETTSDPQVLNFVYSVFNNKRPETTMSSTKPLYIPIPTQNSIREAKRAAKLAEVGVEPSVSDLSRTVQVKNDVWFPAGFVLVEDEEQANKLKEALVAQRTLHSMLQNTNATTSLQRLRQTAASSSSSSSSLMPFISPSKSLALAIIPNVEGLSPKSQQALAIRGSKSVGLQSSILKTQFGARMLSLPAEALGQGQRPSLQSAAAGIGYAAEARAAIRTALTAQAKVLHSMEETEVTLRYGMFLLALMYFRIMNQLSRLRKVFSGNAVFTSEDGEKIQAVDSSITQSTNILGLTTSTLKAMTLERQGMVQAEMNKMRREGAKALSNAKAAAGFAAMHARKVARETSARLDAIREERKRVRLNRAATKIQSIYRGVHVRKTIGELRLRQNAYSEFMVLKTFAAVRIQAAWRGHVARTIVLEKRRELENFIKFYRAMEADDMLSEYYNQNLLQSILKKNATKRTNEDEEVLRLSVAQARLVDDAEINKRLGKAKAKEPIPTYGNLARTDKHDLGKTQEQIDFEKEEEMERMRYARAIQDEETDRNRKLAKMKVSENRAEYVGTGRGIPLAEAIKYEDQNGNKREELDLDRPGRDAAFFNIREPKVYIPVGSDRLRALMQQGYAHATSRAFAAEKASVYETGLVQDAHLLLDDDDDKTSGETRGKTTKVKYSERWANRTGDSSSTQTMDEKIAAFEERSKAKAKR